MLFSEVIGHSTLKQRLIRMQDSGRAPHALLFSGNQGVGKLPLALAYAQRLCCQHPTSDDACGQCASCRQFAKLSHPDLHLLFPLVKPEKAKEAPLCSEMAEDFASAVLENPYISIDQWSAMISDGKVARYYDKEGDEIIRQVNLKSYDAPYKVMVLWCPERMDETASNHLLKVLEEPPSNTVFLLVSDFPQKIIGTIRSRVQDVAVPPIADEDMLTTLAQQHPELDEAQRTFFVRNAHGNWNALLNSMEENEDEMEYFNEFQSMMRHAYRPLILEVKNWSEQVGGRKRTWVVTFLQKSQRLIRENFVFHLQLNPIVYMNEAETQFATRFAQFIHANNIEKIMNELALAQAQIEQNANMKIVLFDMILKLYSLLAIKE
ncbi:MAG: DNA polymerase III subunit delta [Bacteroidales bacterium]|nr:DNA polymerase III subunit delta [Bacteroidales bacterium]